MEIEPNFFDRGEGMTRDDIISFPRKFGLQIPDSPLMYTAAAAAMYKEVSKDIDCGGAYGPMTLLWLDQLKSPHLVVAIISQLQEEGEPRNVCISKLFKECPQEVNTVRDEDVEVISCCRYIILYHSIHKFHTHFRAYLSVCCVGCVS